MSRLERSWQDLRHAVRALRRAPSLTAAAVVTLALGIGATTTIFSMIQAVVLRRLPVTSPHQLFFIAHGTTEPLSTSSHYPWFERVKQLTDVFAGMTAYNVRDFKVVSSVGIEQVVGQYVSGNFHGVIGVPFQLGRGFTSEDDRVMNPVAVISDSYWSRRFGRSRDVLGAVLTIGGHRITIVGVTARGFDGTQPGQSIEITLPLSLRIHDDPGFLVRTDTWTGMPVIVRLKPGVDSAQARAAIAATYRDFMSLPANQEFSGAPGGQLREATLQSAARGSDRLRNGYALPLYILMAMVGLVLVIACVNIASLLLIQAPARAREVAVRMALGAGRRRIIRQLLTESLLLAVCGGALGLLLAAWGARFVSLLLRSGMRPIVVDIQPDTDVLIFAMIVSGLAGMGFGLAPAWRTTRIDLMRSLKIGSPWSADRHGVGQYLLVAIQIALSLVLTFGAGLLVRTVQNLHGLNAGFRKDSLVLFQLDANDTPFPHERLATLCGELIDRFNARPDVMSGSCSTMSPVATNVEGRAVTVPGVARGSGNRPMVFANSVDPSYFTTLGIDIVSGRAFSRGDTATSAKVGILSQTMASYYFGKEDPIGRMFRFGARELGPPITIVGIARDARQQLRDAPPHMAYTPLGQRDEPSPVLLVAVRASGRPAGLTASVDGEVRALTRSVAVSYVRTMDEQIDAALVGERLLATLSSSFAILALVLATVGLYGVMSYSVTRRVREIGIRLALGARHTQIVGQVLRQVSIVALAGLSLGIAGAISTSDALSRFLFGLAPRDPATLILATGVLTATSLLAGYVPARRAARVDPAITLRME